MGRPRVRATLTIGTGIIVTVTGNTAVTPGSSYDSLINQGTIEALNGGKFFVVAGAFVNAGHLTPGNPPQLLNITGGAHYTQLVAGVLNIHIGGTTPGTGFSQLNATGDVGLDGTLNLTLINGFHPNVDDTFEIMTFPSRSGQYATTNGLDIGNGRTFQVNYSATNVVLTVVSNAILSVQTPAE